jgi:hypothetical protein
VSRVKLALGVLAAQATYTMHSVLLRRADLRPVGLTVDPPVVPAMLDYVTTTVGAGVTDIILTYGRPYATVGPFIEVQTCFVDEDDYLPPLEEAMTRAGIRDHAWAREDRESRIQVFEPAPEIQVPDGGFDYHKRAVIVWGQQRCVPVVSRGGREGLRFTHDSMVVTAVARHGFPESLAFDLVEDVEPYLAEHRRFTLSRLHP